MEILFLRPSLPEPGYYMDVDYWTGEMVKTGYNYQGKNWDVSESLVGAGTLSKIPRTWEIMESFFVNYNVHPLWHFGNYTYPAWDPQTGLWTVGFIKKVLISKFVS